MKVWYTKRLLLKVKIKRQQYLANLKNLLKLFGRLSQQFFCLQVFRFQNRTL